MEKIKVMHIVHGLIQGDGITEVVWNLAKNINQDRFSLSVCCLSVRGNLAECFEGIGVKVFCIGGRSTISSFSMPRNLYALAKLIILLKNERLDILHAHEFFAGTIGRVAGWLANIRIIFLGLHNRDEWKKTPHIFVDRCLAKITDKIVCNSIAVRDFTIGFESLSPGIFEVIHNGIDLSKFKDISEKDLIKQEFGLKGDRNEFVVGSVGRLAEQKGFRYLIKAIDIIHRKNRNIKLLIIGGDSHPSESVKSELYKQVKILGLEDTVIFTGIRKDIPNVLNVFDVFVLPSLWEGFGLVTVEAMAMKKPVIATSVDAIPEIVKNGTTGILVPPKDSETLARKILDIVRDKEKAKRMGIEARKRVEKYFTAEIMVKKYETLYCSVYSKKYQD